ncbi:MAG TPA: cyd operon YbgE family protein [Noviherbaspirillum sp.]|nr:cyd operon YbgE family protein [Noviherbaspirillum sp.]
MDREASGLAWLPLSLAMALMLVLTVYPRLLIGAGGSADHVAALFAMLAVSAGFVRGVGFLPRHAVARWLFSTRACLLGIALMAARLAFG